MENASKASIHLRNLRVCEEILLQKRNYNNDMKIHTKNYKLKAKRCKLQRFFTIHQSSFIIHYIS